MEFMDFPKMARLSREVIVTEKVDGTNAQVGIVELDGYDAAGAIYQSGGLALYAGSRTRWLSTKDDNYGFAKWAEANAEELLKLGPGRHFGEWWGSGIQRRYDQQEKQFALFNVSRWQDDAVRPTCCGTVPVIARGIFTDIDVDQIMADLSKGGSLIAPGFMNPEGIVVYHVAAGIGFKKTIHKDEVPKALANG